MPVLTSIRRVNLNKTVRVLHLGIINIENHHNQNQNTPFTTYPVKDVAIVLIDKCQCVRFPVGIFVG